MAKCKCKLEKSWKVDGIKRGDAGGLVEEGFIVLVHPLSCSYIYDFG